MRLIEHTPKRWAGHLERHAPISESIIALDSRGRIDWDSLGDDALAAYARWMIGHEGITGRAELDRRDRNLYNALKRRGLLDSVGLADLRGDVRRWAAMDDGGLAAYAKEFIAENGINGRKGLEKADGALYKALRMRGLLEELGLPEKRMGWAAMGRGQMIAYAKRFISERRIGGRAELERENNGLYIALRVRRLLEEIGLPKPASHMGWASMNPDELSAIARGFIASRGITGRKSLHKAYAGLYMALRRRGMLDEVFSSIESSKHRCAVDGVMRALESFGDDG